MRDPSRLVRAVVLAGAFALLLPVGAPRVAPAASAVAPATPPAGALMLLTRSLPPAARLSNYAFQLTASGGMQPYSFAVSTERFRAFGVDRANLWHEGGLHRVIGGREVRLEFQDVLMGLTVQRAFERHVSALRVAERQPDRQRREHRPHDRGRGQDLGACVTAGR